MASFHEIWPPLVSATGVGYWAVAYGVSRWLTRRTRAHVPLPKLLTNAHVQVDRCVSTEGISLSGWIVEPTAPRGTIALFHGMRCHRGQVLDRIDFLTAARYRCVAFDFRAHGESGGRWTSFGFHERHDVAAVAKLIAQRWPGEPCAALGVSMGGAALCFAGEAANLFDAVILESVYRDLAGAFRHRVGRDYPAWFQHFHAGVVRLTERRLGARIADVAPIDHVGKIRRPILALTGSEDRHAPPEEMHAIAAAAYAGQFRLIEGAGHSDVCEHGGDIYREQVLSFLERNLFVQRRRASA